MNCRKVTHLLSAYIDGELPGVEHRQIHEHLAQCAECLQEHRGLLQMKRMLASMRMREPVADLPERILAQVHAPHSAHSVLPLSAWTAQIALWLRTQAPKPQTLALVTGMAVVGIVFASYSIDHMDHSEQIVWQTATPSQIAELQPAPLEDTNALPSPAAQSLPVSAPQIWTPLNGSEPSSRSRRPYREMPAAPNGFSAWPAPQFNRVP